MFANCFCGVFFFTLRTIHDQFSSAVGMLSALCLLSCYKYGRVITIINRSLSSLPQDDVVTAAIAYSYHVTYQTASHWCVWSPRRWTGLRCECSQSRSHRWAEVGPSSWPGCCRSGLWSGCRWPVGGLPSERTLIAWSRSHVQAMAPL